MISRQFVNRSRSAAAKLRSAVISFSKRPYHFASTDFDSCLDRDGIPDPVDTGALRRSAIKYLDEFDKNTWYSDPCVTLLGGTALGGGAEVDTVDAFHRVNGRAIEATSAQVDAVIKHVEALKV